VRYKGVPVVRRQRKRKEEKDITRARAHIRLHSKSRDGEGRTQARLGARGREVGRGGHGGHYFPPRPTTRPLSPPAAQAIAFCLPPPAVTAGVLRRSGGGYARHACPACLLVLCSALTLSPPIGSIERTCVVIDLTDLALNRDRLQLQYSPDLSQRCRLIVLREIDDTVGARKIGSVC